MAPQQNETVEKTVGVLDMIPKQRQAVALQQNETVMKNVVVFVHNTTAATGSEATNKTKPSESFGYSPGV